MVGSADEAHDKQRQFKILSLDGGGIKGLFTARYLELVEHHLQSTWGNDARIVDAVDLVCGTSTGGIIALGIANRIPMSEICHFYETSGPKIFRRSQGFFATLKQTMLGGKFSDAPLRKALTDVFSDRTLGDSDCLLCIPTFNITQGTYEVFKYDHSEGKLSRHNRLKCIDVALATSAAPTYFPIAEIGDEDSRQYVDGGVWANNPSMLGYLEAIRYFVGSNAKFRSFSLFSISTLRGASGRPPFLKRQRGFVRWAPDLFELGSIGQSEFCDVFLSSIHINPDMPFAYTRIHGPIPPPKQARFIKFDYANKTGFVLMKQYATDAFYESVHSQAFKNFWSEKKLYVITKARPSCAVDEQSPAP